MIGTAAALLGSAAIGAGASLFAGSQQSKAAKNALAQQKVMYEQARSDSAPFMNVGKGALMSLGQLYGIDKDGNATGQPFNPESVKAFENSPDYKFAFDQGMKGLTFSNAAKGLLKSGGNLKDIVQFGQGQATQNFQNYANRLLALSNIGAGTASGNMQAALGAAGQNSAMINQQGQASASGVVGAANAASGALGTYGNQLYLQNLMTQMRSGSGTGTGASFPVGGSNPVPYAGTSGPGMGLPQFADGGQAPGEQDIIVGERGPEIIRLPPGGGEVIPNELARANLPMYMDETRGAYPVGTGQDAVAPRNRMDAAYDTSKSRWGAVADYMRKALIGDPEAKIQVPLDESGRPTDMNLPGSTYKEVYGQDHPAGQGALDLGLMATPAVMAKPISTGLSIASELMGMAPKTATALGAGGTVAALTDTTGDAADKVRPSQQQKVLVDGLKSKMDRTDEEISKIRDTISGNVSKAAELGTTMTKSPKGTQENAQKILESANTSSQKQLDTLLEQQSKLREAHGRASDKLTEQMNAEDQQDRDSNSAEQARLASERPTVDKYPWVQGAPYAGGLLAAAFAYNPRLRAVALHNDYVERMAEVMKKAESAISKNAKSPQAGKYVKIVEEYKAGYPAMADAMKTGWGSSVKSTLAGGATAAELSMAPYQLDWATAGDNTEAHRAAVERLATPTGWAKTGATAFAGITGGSVGSAAPTWLKPMLPDLERAAGIVQQYDAAKKLKPGRAGTRGEVINFRGR